MRPRTQGLRRIAGTDFHHVPVLTDNRAAAYAEVKRLFEEVRGATCHYVTEALDQGPIIEQDVIRIDHSDSVEDMVRYGKDIEKTLLARELWPLCAPAH